MRQIMWDDLVFWCGRVLITVGNVLIFGDSLSCVCPVMGKAFANGCIAVSMIHKLAQGKTLVALWCSMCVKVKLKLSLVH